MPYPNDKPPTDGTSRQPAQDPFTTLFTSLWNLPTAVYQRGGEHGREFNRVMNERRESKAEEQEQEDGRRGRACGWRGRRERHARKQEEAEKVEVEKVMDDWVGKVVKELERGEEQAREMYEWWEKMEKDGEDGKVKELVRVGDGMRGRDGKEAVIAKSPIWSEIFPAWSSEPMKKEGAHHEHVFGREGRRRPLSSTAKDVEDTIDKLHGDFGRLLGDVDQWSQSSAAATNVIRDSGKTKDYSGHQYLSPNL